MLKRIIKKHYDYRNKIFPINLFFDFGEHSNRYEDMTISQWDKSNPNKFDISIETEFLDNDGSIAGVGRSYFFSKYREKTDQCVVYYVFDELKKLKVSDITIYSFYLEKCNNELQFVIRLNDIGEITKLYQGFIRILNIDECYTYTERMYYRTDEFIKFQYLYIDSINSAIRITLDLDLLRQYYAVKTIESFYGNFSKKKLLFFPK